MTIRRRYFPAVPLRRRYSQTGTLQELAARVATQTIAVIAGPAGSEAILDPSLRATLTALDAMPDLSLIYQNVRT